MNFRLSSFRARSHTALLAALFCLLPGHAAAEPFECRSVNPRNVNDTLDDARIVDGTNVVDAMCSLAEREGIVGRDPCLKNPNGRMNAAARFRCFAPGTDGGRRIANAAGSARLPDRDPAAGHPPAGNPMLPTAGEAAACGAETEGCRATCQRHRNNPDAFRYIGCMQPCEVQRASCQNRLMRARLKPD
jgi:hypothetical protein